MENRATFVSSWSYGRYVLEYSGGPAIYSTLDMLTSVPQDFSVNLKMYFFKYDFIIGGLLDKWDTLEDVLG